jgi:hypothetical protein
MMRKLGRVPAANDELHRTHVRRQLSSGRRQFMDPAAPPRFVDTATELAQFNADYDLIVTANLRVAQLLESPMRSQRRRSDAGSERRQWVVRSGFSENKAVPTSLWDGASLCSCASPGAVAPTLHSRGRCDRRVRAPFFAGQRSAPRVALNEPGALAGQVDVVKDVLHVVAIVQHADELLEYGQIVRT